MELTRGMGSAKRLFIITAWIVAAVISTGPIYAFQRMPLFEAGNRLFQAGEYQKALESYQAILIQGYSSATLYYNIGNAHYKLGRIPRAILAYERALRLNPRDQDIRFNLEVVNAELVDEIPRIPELLHVRILRSIHTLFGLDSLTALMVVSYLIFAALLGILILGFVRFRKLIKIASIAFGVLFTAAGLLFLSKAAGQRSDSEAIVMADVVDVKSAPGEEGIVVFSLHYGLKVRVLIDRGGWKEIRIPDGKVGWLESDTIEVI
jgi:tetratricopeptide (TPR) repeat protein